MQKRSVFILQGTKDACDELVNKFASHEKYAIVGATCDGQTAINKIAELSPDFLIADLVLFGCDGLSVIERIKEKSVNTNIIVLSALCREEIISRSMVAGVRYFMTRPYDFDILVKRIDEIAEQKSSPLTFDGVSAQKYRAPSLDEKISKIFINVGIPPHIKGYAFLREGVKMAVEDPEIINNITKKLYPMIGEKYSTTASKVERAIRHAIEVAWNRGRIESINAILGVRAYVGAEKPTNGEFIALVADKMLLEKR